MGKNFDKKNKNFKKFDRDKSKFKSNFKGNFKDFQQGKQAKSAKISEITVANKEEVFTIRGMVDRVVQTGGPTVFYINDGTGNLAIKAFDGAGVRAHPEIEEKDFIQTDVEIGEFNSELEGEVIAIRKLDENERAEFAKHIAQVEKERAKVIEIDFLVEDKILDKLRSSFIKAAFEIKLAVIQNRPIIVRHHNDTDGYSSGYAMERAILPLIIEQHKSEKAAHEFFTRAPCNAPMYEIDDSIRDTARSLEHEARFSNKMPLVVIVDTGSGEESLMGIQQGKVHGIDFIVVDHHPYDEDLISKEVLVHINPFLVGEEGSKFSAGMLCTELARFVNNKVDILQIPAMAGIADSINNPKVIDGYLAHAAKKNYDKKLLMDIATVIDFISAKLRFMEAREYIEVLFGEPMAKQKALVSLLAPYIRNLEKKGLEIAKGAVKSEKVGKTTVQILEIENTYSRGFYPKPGKCVGLIHDYGRDEKKISNLVTLGTMPDAVTMRATDDANFSVAELIEFLNKKVPGAFVEGGGHKNAGSIKFLPSKNKEVIEAIKTYIKSK